MRNLKRTLSLVLAALMLMGMMVVGAGAAGVDDFSDKDEIVNKDAVSMLTILGVINGKEDGSYYAPKDNVTRAEMAKMIATILNQGADVNDLYANLETGLTDIDNSWAKGYINYCYSLGIIAGRGNGTFDPTAPVTGNEAAKMLLVAIGYDPEVEGLTGASWAIKTTSLASTLGIFDDLTAPTAENLNRDNAALLIYNALDVEMIQKYEDGYAMIFDDHRTLLSNKYGVYKVEGIVTANEWAELNQTNSEATAKTGKTTLDHVKVYASTTSNTTVAEYVEEKEPVTFNVSTDVSMLGKAVTMYIKKTTVLANSTVLGVTVDDKVNVIEGTVANSSKVTDLLKGTGLSVTDDTEYYVNYGYETASKAAELISDYDWTKTASKFNMNGVDVKLIDNNNDGDVEYVLYIRETLSNVVRTNTKDETVTINVPVVDANGILTTTTSKASTTTQVLDNADVVTSMELAADDLILYVQYGGRTYITEPTIVTGTMTRVDRDQAEELYITVDDGETYKMSYIREVESQVDADITRFYIENAGQSTGAKFDTKYDFILDSNGYIVAFRPAEDVVANYGLVIGSAWTQNALTKAGEVKILRADNVEQTYTIDWKASDDCFTNGETGLENYLGTRDVNNNIGGTTTGNNLNNAAGTVIEYSLTEDNILTIENVLNLNGLTAGKLTVASNGDQSKITIDDNSKAVAKIDSSNPNFPANLQYNLNSKYENGNGYLNVNVKGTAVQETFAIDKNTIAFYYDVKDDGTVKYGVATGWENMGDVAANVDAQVYPVITKSGGQYVASSLADVVLFNAELTTNTANYMLVLNANAVDSKNLELNVVFEDGTTAAITVSKSDYGTAFGTNASFMKAYKYGVDGNGKYTIDTTSAIAAKPAALLQNGTVDVNGTYLTILGNTNIWDVTDVDSANDEVTTGSFDYVNKKWAVVVDTNSGKTMKTAWVWDMDSDNIYGTSCTFDWNLTNYETVWATGTIYDYMQLAQALNSGKNVRVVGNLTLTYPLNIPAGITVQVEGNLTTTATNNVTGQGNLRVYGTYYANSNIVVPTQVLALETADNISIKADTHVYNSATLGATVTNTATNTIDTGVHFCSRNGTVDAWNYLVINGHYESNDTILNVGGEINSTNTMIVFGNLTIKSGTLTVGKTAAGNLVMAGNGTISGNGTLQVGTAGTVDGNVTLTTGSAVNMAGSVIVDAKGTISQNYVSGKTLTAGSVTINGGTVNVPGSIVASTGSVVIGANSHVTVTGTISAPNGVVSISDGATVETGSESGKPGTGLALGSLTVKGQSIAVSGSDLYVNLSYAAANNTNSVAFAYSLANDTTNVTVSIRDEHNNAIVGNTGTNALSTGVYTIVLSSPTADAVTYRVHVTVGDAIKDTSLTSITVKGVTASKVDDSTANGSEEHPIKYEVELTYNLAWDTVATQLSIVTKESSATVANFKAGTTNIADITDADADKTGTVAAGFVTFSVKADKRNETFYQLEVKVNDSKKVTLNTTVDSSNVTLSAYKVSGDTKFTAVAGNIETVSNKEMFLQFNNVGYEGLKVYYQILSAGAIADEKAWVELPANPDGTYTLTTTILAQAEGKTIVLKAEATTPMVQFTVKSSTNVMVNNVPVSGNSLYVSQNSTATVSVKAGEKVSFNGATYQYVKAENGYDIYNVTFGTVDASLTVG